MDQSIGLSTAMPQLLQPLTAGSDRRSRPMGNTADPDYTDETKDSIDPFLDHAGPRTGPSDSYHRPSSSQVEGSTRLDSLAATNNLLLLQQGILASLPTPRGEAFKYATATTTDNGADALYPPLTLSTSSGSSSLFAASGPDSISATLSLASYLLANPATAQSILQGLTLDIPLGQRKPTDVRHKQRGVVDNGVTSSSRAASPAARVVEEIDAEPSKSFKESEDTSSSGNSQRKLDQEPQPVLRKPRAQAPKRARKESTTPAAAVPQVVVSGPDGTNMPNVGQPSRGCQTCRNRRIRCDRARPICGQCIKSKRECLGYREQGFFIFRNETDRVERKHSGQAAAGTSSAAAGQASSDDLTGERAHGQRRVSPGGHVYYNGGSAPAASASGRRGRGRRRGPQSDNSSAVATLSAPQVSLSESQSYWHAQAVCYFVTECTLIPGQLKLEENAVRRILVPVYSSTANSSTSPLTAMVAALSLQALAQKVNSLNMRNLSTQYYSEAISKLKQAISDPVMSKSNATLLCVMLLAIRENVFMTEQNTLSSWRKHIEGAAALIRLRGAANVRKDPVARVMIRSVRNQMVAQYIRRCEAIPSEEIDELWSLAGTVSREEDESLYLENSLNFVALHVPELRARAVPLMYCRMTNEVADKLAALRRDARRLDEQMQQWFDNLPASWRQPTKHSHSIPPPGEEVPTPKKRKGKGKASAEHNIEDRSGHTAEDWPFSEAYDGNYYVYPSQHAAYLINAFSMWRIFACMVVFNCTERLVPPKRIAQDLDYQYAVRKMQNAADLVCGSIPFVMHARTMPGWPESCTCANDEVEARKKTEDIFRQNLFQTSEVRSGTDMAQDMTMDEILRSYPTVRPILAPFPQPLPVIPDVEMQEAGDAGFAVPSREPTQQEQIPNIDKGKASAESWEGVRENTAKPQNPAFMSFSGLPIIWQVYVPATTITIPYRQRKWLVDQLEAIAKHHGVEIAQRLADACKLRRWDNRGRRDVEESDKQGTRSPAPDELSNTASPQPGDMPLPANLYTPVDLPDLYMPGQFTMEGIQQGSAMQPPVVPSQTSHLDPTTVSDMSPTTGQPYGNMPEMDLDLTGYGIPEEISPNFDSASPDDWTSQQFLNIDTFTGTGLISPHLLMPQQSADLYRQTSHGSGHLSAQGMGIPMGLEMGVSDTGSLRRSSRIASSVASDDSSPIYQLPSHQSTMSLQQIGLQAPTYSRAASFDTGAFGSAAASHGVGRGISGSEQISQSGNTSDPSSESSSAGSGSVPVSAGADSDAMQMTADYFQMLGNTPAFNVNVFQGQQQQSLNTGAYAYYPTQQQQHQQGYNLQSLQQAYPDYPNLLTSQSFWGSNAGVPPSNAMAQQMQQQQQQQRFTEGERIAQQVVEGGQARGENEGESDDGRDRPIHDRRRWPYISDFAPRAWERW